jgi:Putative peptidoglycan binding domain/Domain of unknown function (DUF4347)
MINRNYTYLRVGNHLPSVGVLQKLLKRAGAKLDSDGIFGNKTLLAVQNFQRAHHLAPDGRVGIGTWRKLARGLKLPIVDCVDIYDAAQREQLQQRLQREKDKKRAMDKKEVKKLEKRLDELTDSRDEVDMLRAVGGNPFVLGGMSNGLEQAISSISGAARDTFLMRFHGHGHPGSVAISAGSGGSDQLNRINLISLGQDPVQLTSSLAMLQRSVARLRSMFGAYGSCELYGCKTGRGAEGRQFLSTFASVIGVPVTAALIDQNADPFKFRGPTYTATPSGVPLKAWCRALPDLPS